MNVCHVEESIPPQGQRGSSMAEEAANTIHKHLVASFGHTILLRRLGVGDGVRDAMRGTESLEGMIEKFPPPITPEVDQGATKTSHGGKGPGLKGLPCVRLAMEEDGSTVQGMIIHDGEEILVAMT